LPGYALVGQCQIPCIPCIGGSPPAFPRRGDVAKSIDAAENIAMRIRAAIVGPTGYTGYHLIDLLLRHPEFVLTALASHREQPPDIRDEFPALAHRLDPELAQCIPIDVDRLADQAEVAFLALPHRAAMAYAPKLLDRNVKVVDLSADYRLHSASHYEAVYEHPHGDEANLTRAVYGLPEFFRERVTEATLIANPGCYPTTAALAAAPLIRHSLVRTERIICNAASGVTGAGRKAAAHLHFPEMNESFFPYGQIGAHRHQPEIEQTLTDTTGQSTHVLFVPHLLPINQGILATLYLEPHDPTVTEQELFEACERTYADEPFVRVRDTLPNVRHVRDTNYCDITVRLTGPADQPTVVVFAALDNMIKGAAGQAIQNMNLMFDIDEAEALV
jgi:N-acetyl-gamma-glutamyl-phosphate reductase